MKQLIRRLSRVADSSSTQYCPIRSEPLPRAARTKLRRAPHGHLPIYVGNEMERFVVSAELLNHPVFIALLNKSAQEYGYEQKGVLRIPCHVLVFERILEAMRVGQPLDLNSFCDECS